ncbi:MAG TPA: branched-chain amino acid ABC transporter ATP-binding protein/permease [Dehalococcoidales bacterium]|nr:branched-chain amino acid ABC transporter ATP-binding protein/permease [Dehalococcoidales bacterium]
MSYVIHILNMCLIWAMLGVSLNLLLGYTGLMSMGHAAFFTVGAYGSALLAIHLGVNFYFAMLLGILIGVLIGFLTAVPALRVRDDYLILLTLGIQMVTYGVVVAGIRFTGGTQGLTNIPPPTFFGIKLQSAISFLPLILIFCAIVVAISLRLINSPFGRVLRAIRDDDIAARSVGKNVTIIKVIVFAIASGMAAMAGSIYAHYSGFIAASSFTVDQSIAIVVVVIVGGTANIWGSVVGAVVMVVLPQLINYIPGTALLISPIREVVYGAMLILFIRFRPQGLIPENVTFRTKKPVVPDNKDSNMKDVLANSNSTFANIPVSQREVALQANNLYKHFGGVLATDNASFSLHKGTITALIGPNGAGKTTIFNLLTGFIQADKGTVIYRGRDITRLPPYLISRIGMTRSFQEVRLFRRMSVIDNVMTVFPKQAGENFFRLFFNPWLVKKQEQENQQQAMAWLGFVGLQNKAQELAGDISFAEQKLLVLACVLATGSDVLLLDEVVSGIDPEAINKELDLLRKIADSGKAICIIEHNIDVVKRVADIVYFLASGQVIASGTPGELTSNPELTKMYFGT